MLALIDEGFDRQKAYELVQKIAMRAWKTGRDFAKLIAGDKTIRKHLGPSGLKEILDLKYYVRWADKIINRL